MKVKKLKMMKKVMKVKKVKMIKVKKMMMLMMLTVVHLTNRVVTLLYKIVAGVDGGRVARWVVGVLIIKRIIIVRMV